VDRLRIGTRGSQLARWQAAWVAERLKSANPGLDVDLVEIKTEGDRDRHTPLAAIGGTGVFTKEIQRALASGDVDLAVHSLKDLPTKQPDGLILGAIPPRESVADALIAPVHRTFAGLPDGAKVGTGSLRRKAQVLYLRPNLRVVSIRGNVETRLSHALDGRVDAIVLAEAGLCRLGLDRHITENLRPPRFLPAVGQGALAIECRENDVEIRTLITVLDDPAARRAVAAERQLLAELEGGCMIPLAAWGRDSAEGLSLDAAVFDSEGRERVAWSESGPIDDPARLGSQVAEKLRALGAERLLRPIR
jgi:hydroxymethylbilane synthase